MARRLIVNVAVGDVMYGPDYPENGQPPADRVGDHCFEGSNEPEQPARRPVTKKSE